MLCVDEGVDTVVAWVNLVAVGLGILLLNRCKLGYAMKVACVPPSLSRRSGPALLDFENPVRSQEMVPACSIHVRAADHSKCDGRGLSGSFLDLRWL